MLLALDRSALLRLLLACGRLAKHVAKQVAHLLLGCLKAFCQPAEPLVLLLLLVGFNAFYEEFDSQSGAHARCTGAHRSVETVEARLVRKQQRSIRAAAPGSSKLQSNLGTWAAASTYDI